MLIDPLSDEPTVITGSANFSEPSTDENDENMLVISGDKRVADIYLGEFMRVFTHFYFRGKAGVPNGVATPAPGTTWPATIQKRHLREDDSWAKRFYQPGSPREKERNLIR